MDLQEQTLTDKFKDDVAYERLVLTTLTEAETVYHGRPGLIHDLCFSSPKITSIGGHSARAEVVREIVPQLRPLVFGAAYKILDLFIEFVLKLNGKTPPKNGWPFEGKKGKKEFVAEGCPRLPTILSPPDGIWDRMATVYIDLLEARHCIVHRRSDRDSDGTLKVYDRNENALKPLTPIEQDKFAESIYLLSEVVIRKEISSRQRNAILNALDYLEVHHGHPKTGITVPVEVPQVIVNLISIDEGRWQLNLKSIRDHLAECQPWAEAADIELYRPGEEIAAFSTQLEDLNEDVLEFSEGALPHGVRVL